MNRASGSAKALSSPPCADAGTGREDDRDWSWSSSNQPVAFHDKRKGKRAPLRQCPNAPAPDIFRVRSLKSNHRCIGHSPARAADFIRASGPGPPFVRGTSTYFLSINRGKRSVALDLKKQKTSFILIDLNPELLTSERNLLLPYLPEEEYRLQIPYK